MVQILPTNLSKCFQSTGPKGIQHSNSEGPNLIKIWNNQRGSKTISYQNKHFYIDFLDTVTKVTTVYS